MTGALAIFVKTPGHSSVKSRLAAECGERYATDWYRHASAAVASVARAAHAGYGVTAYWAVAEPDALVEWTDLPVIGQGEGSLGERMACVHSQLVARHGFGLLIGADAPQVTVELLGEAFTWLAATSPRLALGPARDGGFWLFGGNVAPTSANWLAVQYSAANTARDLQHSMRGVGEWLTLKTLSDVDIVSDLDIVHRDLQALPTPTIEQCALLHWMRKHDAALLPSPRSRGEGAEGG
ncbi:MAG: DUF2064 domain-containing protein [Lysobacterales bacterium]